jgi:RNA polymerase sigma-70 factor, ECF subfamily
LVYDELCELARDKTARELPEQTLQATALVREAYLSLVDVLQAEHWNGRCQFFAAAGLAMRRILISDKNQNQAPLVCPVSRIRERSSQGDRLMTGPNQSESQELIARAARGDDAARHQLLAQHRDRLKRMVSVHLDHRLAARFDPSDIVQEALLDAHRELSDYLRRRPLPVYPWLRQLAWERLLKWHRAHIQVQKRSVGREEARELDLPEESAAQLAYRLIAAGTSPSRRLIRDELRQRVRAALEAAPPRDREILVMRHLEEMPAAEIAATLGITERAVKARHTRALERLRGVLDEDSSQGETLL